MGWSQARTRSVLLSHYIYGTAPPQLQWLPLRIENAHCLRGTAGAVRVPGSVAAIAETLGARARAAVLRGAQLHRQAGRAGEAETWSAAARTTLLARRGATRGRSVHTVSGGLPTLGRRK